MGNKTIPQREKERWNELHRERSPRGRVSLAYRLSRHIRQEQEALVLRDCNHKKVLEYGCGTGTKAFLWAQHGARGFGIDVSDYAINQAKSKAEEANVDVFFLEMDAESLGFEDNSFDLVVGRGILHHLDIAKACREIHRVLKENGRAIFIEPLCHNPAIALFRKLTPNLRSEDEHPLSMKDLDYIKSCFRECEIQHYILLTLFGLPFVRFRFFHSVDEMLHRLDEKLFKVFPFLKRYSWQVLIGLRR